MEHRSEDFPPKNTRKTTELIWKLSRNSRQALKRGFARVWLRERRYHKYKYVVETCFDGTRVYLTRPARFNQGIDFQVWAQSPVDREGKQKKLRPSYKWLVRDLRRKLRKRPRLRRELYRAIGEIFDCREPRDIVRRHPRLQVLSGGASFEVTMCLLKWLFIEQDLTYWLGTGRNRLMRYIENKVFKMKVADYT